MMDFSLAVPGDSSTDLLTIVATFASELPMPKRWVRGWVSTSHRMIQFGLLEIHLRKIADGTILRCLLLSVCRICRCESLNDVYYCRCEMFKRELCTFDGLSLWRFARWR